MIGTLNQWIAGRNQIEYRCDTVEQKRITDKEYYKNNSERRKQKTTEWSKQNKERKANYDKEYNQTHKEQIKETRQRYKEKHADEIKQIHTCCVCGDTYQNKNKHAHFRTTKHQQALQKES